MKCLNFIMVSNIFHVINSKGSMSLTLSFSDLRIIYFTMKRKKAYFSLKKNFQKSTINLHVEKFSSYDLSIGSEKALRIFFSLFHPKFDKFGIKCCFVNLDFQNARPRQSNPTRAHVVLVRQNFINCYKFLYENNFYLFFGNRFLVEHRMRNPYSFPN